MSLQDNSTCVVGKNFEEVSLGLSGSTLKLHHCPNKSNKTWGKKKKKNFLHDFLWDHIFPQGGQKKTIWRAT